ncbi:MAG: serine/threonine protein kinase, partial [Nannocystaceae bacterium]|nr:serine/threonine protein kinase [Nannocystaceae bacterium]
MSVHEGRLKTALRGADAFGLGVAPTLSPGGSPVGQPNRPPGAGLATGSDTVRPGHGKTRQFRLGATFLPDPDPEAVPGSLLGAQERYRVVRFLGQGGMGRVYEARRERDGHPAAVKVLRTDRVTGNLAELIARFRQEAAAASRVGHRGIVEMLGFEQAPDGHVIVAMELLEGEPLEDWMARDGTLLSGLGLLAELCDGLHAAHEAGVVHRDIKPANLFLHREPDGTLRPTVLDFGLAKVERPEHTQIETAAGAVLGTPYYLAPERALGKPLDRRADLYSLGVVLYELVTGSLPFEGNSFMAILEGHVRRVPLDPRQAAPERPIPVGVCALAMALLAKDPDVRPQTAADVASTLRALIREHHSELEGCATGPRARLDAGADTISILALAAGHTAAPLASASASADAV